MMDQHDTHEDANCQDVETEVNLIPLSWQGASSKAEASTLLNESL